MNRREFIQTGLSGLATVAAGELLLGNAVDGGKISASEMGEDVREFNLKAEVAEIDIGAKNTFKALR
ncbi:TPA: hypothetical protein EYP66_06275 [Candidatus Poribacteria bacterium]|nr:hypothetical protein [Candidatus Poribacteria bacterium]